MKKLLAICFLIIAVTGFVFSAGTQEKTISGKELSIWVEKSFSDDANLLMEKRIQQFGKENGVKVRYEFINAIDFMTKLNAAIEAGNTPDIVTANLYKVLSYGHNSPFLDVTDLITEIDQIRPMFNSAINGTKIAGHNYYVPFYNSSTLLFLRKDVFEKKGVAIPTTWDELLDAAVKVSDPANGFYGFGMGCGPTDEDGENTFRMINWSNGGALFAPDGTIVANTDPVTLAMVTKYKELYNVGAIPPAAVTWGPSGNNASYLMGEAAMVFNAPTLYNAMVNDPNYSELLSNTLVTSPPEGRAGNTVLGLAFGWGIIKNSTNIETAKNFIKYSYDSTWYNEYLALVMPVFAPVFKDARENPQYASGVNKAVIDYAENASGYYGYPVATLDGMILASKHYYQFPVCTLLNNAVTKGMSPQQALDLLAKDIVDVKASL